MRLTLGILWSIATLVTATLSTSGEVVEVARASESRTTLLSSVRPSRTIDRAFFQTLPSDTVDARNGHAILEQEEQDYEQRKPGEQSKPGQHRPNPIAKGAFGFLNGIANGNLPKNGAGFPHIPTNLIPSPISSFLVNPLPTLASLLPRPLGGGFDPFLFKPTPKPTPTPQSQNNGNTNQGFPPPPPPPKPLPGQNPALRPPPGSPLSNDNKPSGLGKLGHEAQCTQQEIGCPFLRESAYQLQNDEDDCLKMATSFDAEGRIKFDPIAQDETNVIYGITTDGLTASAWCNDVGWALRKIYINCRRGNKCFGGSAYAARNSVFLVTVGPRTDIPSPENRSNAKSQANDNKVAPKRLT